MDEHWNLNENEAELVSRNSREELDIINLFYNHLLLILWTLNFVLTIVLCNLPF